MPQPRLLLLSVGFGQGHHAAAAALAEEYAARGWQVRTEDPCAAAHPRLFHLAQDFYRFCVRQAPWLWGVTYAQTDTADWRRPSRLPFLGDVRRAIRNMLRQTEPHVVLCTYPLYAMMLDELKLRGEFHGRYAVVVTDAREISRPWLQSEAPLIIVPDPVSRLRVCERYGLREGRVLSCGFPVRRAFTPPAVSCPPSAAACRVLYGAYLSIRETVRQVRSLTTMAPGVRVRVLGGDRTPRLQRLLAQEIAAGRVEVAAATDHMAAALAESHLYIGKAGAATMFECYAARVPIIVNFALPGQEQGNAELLVSDGAGAIAESTPQLLSCLRSFWENHAALWYRCRAAMAAAGYDGAAARIADETERRFLK